MTIFFAEARALTLAILLSVVLCVEEPASAQDVFSIRVESNQVLVPTFVFDKTRMGSPPGLPIACPGFDAKNSGKLRSMTKALCRDDVVSGLTAMDFHLFEDGKEQRIKSVKVVPLHNVDVHDNVGHFIEESDTPSGKWSTSVLPRRFSSPIERTFFYLIAYEPPESAEARCHQIKVKVDRHNSSLYARNQYCNTKHSSSDPLNGTRFGKQLGDYVASDQPGKIALSLQTSVFYVNPDTAQIDIALEFPWNSLKREWNMGSLHATIGILGMAYRKDGTLAARLSDLGCCPSDRPEFYRGQRPNENYPDLDVDSIPARYETQIELPAGEYTLQFVLSDGSKFGRAEALLTVDRYDGKDLAISSIALCKRFREAGAASQDAAAVALAPDLVPLVSNGMQFTLSGETRFSNGERLFAYFEVYEPRPVGHAGTTVQTRLRVVNVETGELKVDTGLRSADSSIKPGSTVMPIAEEVAVDKLPIGSYRLEVQAIDSAGKSTAWRAANFTVE